MPETPAICSAALLSLLLVSCAAGATLTVPLPFPTIQEAIDVANTGDVVQVHPGIYNEAIDFAGKAITVRSAAGPQATTIDGDGLSESVVKCISGEGPDSILVGFTITRGTGDVTLTLQANGGGMLIDGSSPTVINCVFRNNSAVDGGGIDILDNAGPEIVNCIFTGNNAVRGGAVSSDGSSPRLTNCTLTGNSATGIGPATGGGAIYSRDSDTAVNNCILWSDTAVDGAEVQIFGGAVAVSHSNVHGGEDAVGRHPFVPGTLSWGAGNIDELPLLTPDGHLASGSPCIDAGSNGALLPDLADLDGDFDTSETLPRDIDGPLEQRITGGTVDMGADEFRDTDGDGLPDWWEGRYFPSITAASPIADPDLDGLINAAEYDAYSSHPTDPPIFVCDACDPAPDGTPAHPFGTIQDGITTARDGDTVLVRANVDTTYAGSGNFNLDYEGKSVVVRKAGPATATIDCGSAGRAVDPDSINGIFAVLEGFTIRNGRADFGGALQIDQSRMMIKNCTLRDNTATAEGGALHSMFSSPTLADVVVGPGNVDSNGAAAVISHSAVQLLGPVDFNSSGAVDVRAARFDGPGSVVMASDATLNFATTVDQRPSTVRTDIRGSGAVHIATGAFLVLAGSATVDLSGSLVEAVCRPLDVPGTTASGVLSADDNGILITQDQARIQNANVDVTAASIEDTTALIHNHIVMRRSADGFGGEFFVGPDVVVACNELVSFGDRYLALDPDPEATERPTITRNAIRAIVNKSPLGFRVKAPFELRAADRDCTTNGVNPLCASGAFRAHGSPGYSDDPSANWVLEELTLLPEAEVNLTNRSGFQFVTGDDAEFAETVYVKDLRLHPDATLNTALQTLYYSRLLLVDTNGVETEWTGIGPPYPYRFDNGSAIVDVPLLGFSLSVISMENQGEFDLRVRIRDTDPADQQSCQCDGTCPGDDPPLDPATCKQGSVVRTTDATHGGVMEMRTRAPGTQPATSVAAKGSFDKAGDETVVVAFEYLFLEDAGTNAELLVYLSNDSDVSENLTALARIRPPAPGRPGAVGSGRFADFFGVFPRGTLRFVRGTYVELELRGQGARVWIDTWDPSTYCNPLACGDFAAPADEGPEDFHAILAENTRSLAITDTDKICMDSVSGDFYIDLADVLAYDAWQSGSDPNEDPFDWCASLYGTVGRADSSRDAAHLAGVLPRSTKSLIISGKPGSAGVQTDWLYSLDITGSGVQCQAAAPFAAGAGADTRGNGRLVADGNGELFQIHGIQGIVRISDGRTILEPDTFIGFSTNGVDYGDVHVGVSDGTGRPLLDAAIHPHSTEDTIVLFVVPVLVVPPDAAPEQGICPYVAAAKLVLRRQPDQSYAAELGTIYGQSPAASGVTITPFVEGTCVLLSYSPDLFRPREVEIDASGNVYVLTTHALNENNWLLVYDEQDGTSVKRCVSLDDAAMEGCESLGVDLEMPSSMFVSSLGDKLYVASSAENAGNIVFRFDVDVTGGLVALIGDGSFLVEHATTDGFGFGHVAAITSIQEDSDDGTLYITGFSAPRFDDRAEIDELVDSVFTLPTLAMAPPDATGTVSATAINCHDLALPLSAVLLADPCPAASDFDADGDVDLFDFAALQRCFIGEGAAGGGAVADCCIFDFEGDADVDLDDYAQFVDQITGP